jgi:hypothetical protein
MPAIYAYDKENYVPHGEFKGLPSSQYACVLHSIRNLDIGDNLARAIAKAKKDLGQYNEDVKFRIKDLLYLIDDCRNLDLIDIWNIVHDLYGMEIYKATARDIGASEDVPPEWLSLKLIRNFGAGAYSAAAVLKVRHYEWKEAMRLMQDVGYSYFDFWPAMIHHYGVEIVDEMLGLQYATPDISSWVLDYAKKDVLPELLQWDRKPGQN